MRVFSSAYAHIDIIKGKQKNGARLTWLAFAKDDQYKAVLKVLMESFKDHQLKFLILDHTNMKLISPDSLEWTRNIFIPVISEIAEKVIVKRSLDVFTLFPTDEIIKSFKSKGLGVSVHETQDELEKELEML